MNWFFWKYPKIDPNTPVQIWEVDIVHLPPTVLFTSKTRGEDSTWEKFMKIIKSAKIPLPKADFGPNNPIILTVITVNGSSLLCIAQTTEEFIESCGKITTRTPYKRKIWLNSVIKSLKTEIKQDELFLSKIAEIKNNLSETKKLIDERHTSLTSAQRKMCRPVDAANPPSEPE